MPKFLIIGMVVLMSGCASSNGSSSGADPKIASNENGLICKSEKVTGSIRAVRVCRTVAETDQDEKRAKEIVRRARNESQINRNSD